MSPKAPEAEWLTRKKRIDPKLDTAGWRLPAANTTPLRQPYRTEEEDTANGPADYALWLDRHVAAIVEAKRLTVGPQGVLSQAARYARGVHASPYNFDGLRCPFLYATNGEVIWFHDVRHPLNRSRQVAAFHTPAALKELLGRNFEADCERLLQLPHDHPQLRPYQKEANAAIDKALAQRKRHLLLAMATGTGKTVTVINSIYRLMKSGVARRVLFLVDRRALAAQAVRAFSSFEAEPGKKFDKLYEVYSSRFQKEDLGDEEPFDPKLLPQRYLTDPQPGHAFVYVCTIQRMAMHILGRQAIFGIGEESIDEDADRLDIPIHAFDLVVADECHRGYTSEEVSVWRSTLDHFDAMKIGLTATPASHTTAYFTHKAFEYSYERAVQEGHLVDYDIVPIRSQVRLQGVFLREGENVALVDPETGLSRMDQLEDERTFETTELERAVTVPDSNRKILAEVKKYTDEHEQRYGRFPKTLIFAVNDQPHTSHADQVVEMAREVFDQGEAFVEKITGRVDRPLQKIREFRNRPNPGVAVTVDLLTTGVDIPDLEYLVFLRPVRSRILFEQMLGRGTRKGERHQDKEHFVVFDCFDGTLFQYFKGSTGITEETPAPPSRRLEEIIEDIWANRDRDYNIGCLVKRLQRIDKAMSAEARELFSAYIPEGDLARYARELPRNLRSDFVGSMKMLRDSNFQRLLVNHPRPRRTFVNAYEHEDTVSSEYVFRDEARSLYKPEDYLQAFSEFVRENEDHMDAIRILLSRPREWSPAALAELHHKLKTSPFQFTLDNLQRAYEIKHRKALVDIISMVKHAARGAGPLLTAAERVEAAFGQVARGRTFTAEQQAWLDRIRQHLLENLSIDREDFDVVPIFSDAGGWGAARKIFGEKPLDNLLHQFNEAIAA